MRARPVAERPGFQRFVAVLAVAVAVVGLAVAANYEPDALREGEARLEVDGRAQVVREGGAIDVVETSTILGQGDEVTVVRGTMRLEFRDGAALEGRAASRVEARPTELRVNAVPELLAGSLLVQSDEPFEVLSAGNHLRVEPAGEEGAAVRLERSLVLAAAAYTGTVELDSAGQRRSIPALREIEVGVLGSPPSDVRALTYEEDDRWDQRFLGEAIDLGRRLDALSGAYTASLDPGTGTTVGFYRQVLPSLVQEVSFTEALLDPNRAPGETLVGLAIAQRGRAGSFQERWQEVFRFRSEGARWGLVALDQDVEFGPLVDDIESALNATPFEFAGPAPTVVEPPPPPVTVAPDAGPTGDDDGADDEVVAPEPAPEPAPAETPPTLLPEIPPLPPIPPIVGGPSPESEEGLVPNVLGPLLETLTSPVNTLLGGLLNP